MHPNTLASLESLDNWTHKIINEGNSGDWHLANFVDAQDIKSFQKFYHEMIPYVQGLKLDIQDIDVLIEQYIANEKDLIDNSIANYFFSNFWADWNDPIAPRVPIDKLMFTLNDIKNNVSTIVYQVKINQG